VRLTALSISVLLLGGLLFADDRAVDFDHHVDFSTLKTFAVREGTIDTASPELDNTFVLKRIADALRVELTSRGLKETLDRPDVIVDYSLQTLLFSEQRGGPISATEGTLVIDLTRRDPRALLWRSVYRDNERSAAKLAQKLPGDVKKSLAEYPPRQKGVSEPNPSTSAAPRFNARTAAAAALDVVRSTLLATDFVGPNTHPGLAISLGMLERAARAVSEDDERSPSASNTKALALYEALNDTVKYATSISERPVETADTRAKARELVAKLRSLSPS
jgi:Domain of unknown function (DUF4136)